MTKYANLKRDEAIIAHFLTGRPPKNIPAALRSHYPELTIHIVYHVIEMFRVNQSCEILRSAKLAKPKSTA